MSRPLRIQYPNAWHHIMNRSGRGQELFTDRDDHICFLDLLQQTSELISVKRGTENEPRNVAIYLMRNLRGEPLINSSVIERTGKRLQKDRNLRKRIKKMNDLLIKGQEET